MGDEPAKGSERGLAMQTYAELVDSIKGRICVRCRTTPRVAWLPTGEVSPEGALPIHAYRLRCECHPQAPSMVKDSTKMFVQERTAEMLQHQDPLLRGRELQVLTSDLSPAKPMTVQEFDERQALIKHVSSTMQEGVHYGRIPGTSDKSLWEPGAEYLRAAFNIAWDYEVMDQVENYETWDFRYVIRAFQLVAPGVAGAAWIASAWSKERRFFCSSRDCPQACNQQHGPRGMEPQMLPHNVRDRAVKRAFVALMRNVTGTTGYFKQTLDTVGVETSEEAEQLPCPIHPGKMHQRRQGRNDEPYYSHKEGSGWCNRNSKEVKAALEAQARQEATDGAAAPMSPVDPSRPVGTPVVNGGDAAGDGPLRPARLPNQPDKPYFYMVALRAHDLGPAAALERLGKQQSGAPIENYEAWIADGHTLEEALAKLGGMQPASR